MTQVSTTTTRLATVLATAAVALLAACVGSGGGGDPAVGTAPGTITGIGTKGPVSGATVKAFAIGSGAIAEQIGITTTDARGAFTVTIGNYAGPVMLQMAGGTFTDEATGTTMTMAPAEMMTAVMPSVAASMATSAVQVTPVTTMAQSMARNMSGGMTTANITTANTAPGRYFMVGDILHTPPMNPLVPGSGAAASPDAANYGMTFAAMSQYAWSQGLAASSGMVTAMVKDASDGIMDGRAACAQIGIWGMGGMGGMGGHMMSPTAARADLADAMRPVHAVRHEPIRSVGDEHGKLDAAVALWRRPNALSLAGYWRRPGV